MYDWMEAVLVVVAVVMAVVGVDAEFEVLQMVILVVEVVERMLVVVAAAAVVVVVWGVSHLSLVH